MRLACREIAEHRAAAASRTVRQVPRWRRARWLVDRSSSPAGPAGWGSTVLRMVLSRGARVTASYRSDGELEAARGGLTEQERGADHARPRRRYRRGRRPPAVRRRRQNRGRHAPRRRHRDWLPTESVALDDWNALMTLNLTSTFLMCKHAIGPMRAAGYGRIVTVGSRAPSRRPPTARPTPRRRRASSR